MALSRDIRQSIVGGSYSVGLEGLGEGYHKSSKIALILAAQSTDKSTASENKTSVAPIFMRSNNIVSISLNHLL